MVLLRRTAHPRGLSLQVKEQVYVKRTRDGKGFKQIASEVWNLAGERPYWKVVRAAFRELTSKKRGPKKFQYHKCGRKAKLRQGHQTQSQSRTNRVMYPNGWGHDPENTHNAKHFGALYAAMRQ